LHDIKLVEYERKYAAALAEMWNKSAENWGGEGIQKNEESMAREMEISVNLKAWLALAGEEVVGYCGFSEYREDEGASYIPLLNVRPDYQGQKVGKLLVLKAVEEACRCPWPRLDLYTWPGNTKAVPLYKKCGFFWEDRDDDTHLMNFIPYVLGTEAVADFFREADWYADSLRELAVEPDGRKENGFDYYEYSWRHGAKSLRLEFERRGRGLRLIETEDWLVSLAAPAQDLAFGRNYPALFHLVNKSGKPLRVSIRGQGDKNISFSLEKDVSVEKELLVQGEFSVGEIDEEPNNRRTSPVLAARLEINGKSALFKVGIVPKFPVLLRGVAPEQEYRAGEEGSFSLNLESGYEEPVEVSFTLPERDFIRLGQRDFSLTLGPREKRALTVPFTLECPGLYLAPVQVSARPQGGDRVDFSQDVVAVFGGRDSCFGGENADFFFAVNGKHMVVLGKYSNNVEVRSLIKNYQSTYLMRPELGLPYSVEFSKNKAKRVEWSEEGGDSILRATYSSTARPGIVLNRLLRLKADGILTQEWKLKNEGDTPAENLWFKAHMFFDSPWLVLPLGGSVVETRDYPEYPSAYELENLRENWVYSTSGKRGLCWAEDMVVKGTDWFWLEAELGTLAPGQEAAIKPICLAMGTFPDWREFRTFARGEKAGAAPAKDSLEIQVNGGNPFVWGDYELKVQQHQKKEFQARITVSSPADPLASRAAVAEDRRVALTLPGPGIGASWPLQVEISTTAQDQEREAVAFGCGGTVTQKGRQLEGLDTLTVDNGVLSFSGANAFGPGVFSLIYQGREWLDTSFPQPAPKSWWNPWLGGIGVGLGGLSDKALFSQPRSLAFIQATDNWGNKWQGLRSEVEVRGKEKYFGLTLRQDILTLPGLAGFCLRLVLEHSGHALNGVGCSNILYLKPDPGVWVQFRSPDGRRVRFRPGEENETPPVHKLQVGAPAAAQFLTAYCPEDLNCYLTGEIIQVTGPRPRNLFPGKQTVPAPQFYFFNAQDIPEAALACLGDIRWS
jgi:ribosomal protein S18 acetylase RimI-like enzyme